MTLQSTKSASDLRAQVKKPDWRLRKTLKRPASFRAIEDEDIRYVFAAYRKGNLGVFGNLFAKPGMSAEEFKGLFERVVIENFHAAWTMLAHTAKGFIPVGCVFAAWGPHAPFMIVTGAVWFPWASKRNMVEAMVGFLDGVRKETPLMFYALPEHKRMYEVCAMHGVIRRVGTSYTAIPGKSAAVFETRVQ